MAMRDGVVFVVVFVVFVVDGFVVVVARGLVSKEI